MPFRLYTLKFLAIGGILFAGLTADYGYAQSTRERVTRLENQLVDLASKYDELSSSIKMKNLQEEGLFDKVEAASVLGQESLGLLREMMENMDRMRQEQSAQLEDILKVKVQIPLIEDRLGNLEHSNAEGLDLGATVKKLDAQLNSGFITRSIRDQEALRGELSRIRGTVEELELAQEKFSIRLRRFYEDLDFRLRQMIITPAVDDEIGLPSKENNSQENETVSTPALEAQNDPALKIEDEADTSSTPPDDSKTNPFTDF